MEPDETREYVPIRNGDGLLGVIAASFMAGVVATIGIFKLFFEQK